MSFINFFVLLFNKKNNYKFDTKYLFNTERFLTFEQTLQQEFQNNVPLNKFVKLFYFILFY